MSLANQNGEKCQFPAGAILFHQGDPGGDLYFIKSGEVEVFREKDGCEVLLARLKENDVLGMMTALNDGQRLASAKAATDVVAIKVSKENLRKVMITLPPWLKTMVKEFTHRIDQVDQMYAEASVEIRDLKLKVPTKIQLSLQVASAIEIMAPFFVESSSSGARRVSLDRVMELTERIAGVAKADLLTMVDVFALSGLCKMDKGQARLMDIDEVKNLENYIAFVSDFRSKKRKSFPSISLNEQKNVLAMCEFAKSLKLDPDTEIKVAFSQIETDMQKQLKRTIDQPLLDKLEEATLLKLDRGDELQIIFRPNQLAQNILYLAAIRRLELGDKNDE